MINNPWRGLASYKDPEFTDSKYLFCGRDKATNELSNLIGNNLCVTLYGQTGIGKTSLLKAGIFPRLRENDYIPFITRLSSCKECDTFAYYITNKLEQYILSINGGRIEKCLETENSYDQSDYLWEYFATRKFYSCDKEIFPVIVIDQFEENFYLQPEKTECLLQQVHSLIDDNKVYPKEYHDDTNFRFVLSIREDNLYLLEDCLDRYRLSELKSNRYRLNYLSTDEATQIIAIPGDKILPDNEVERERIISKILDLVRNNNHGKINTLILSLVCSQLYTLMVENKKNTIDLYDIPQDANNLLTNFYLSATSKTYQHKIEELLIDEEGRRKQISVERISKEIPIWENLMQGSYRILQQSNGMVEIVHDMLAHTIWMFKRNRNGRYNIILNSICLILIWVMLVLCMLVAYLSGENARLLS